MTDKAKHIRDAKFGHPDATTPGTWRQEWLIRPTATCVIGERVNPFTALAWLAGMIVLGVFIAFDCKSVLIRRPHQTFWYSLENAHPLVQCSVVHNALDQGHGWVESDVHLQWGLGVALATPLVGAQMLLPSVRADV